MKSFMIVALLAARLAVPQMIEESFSSRQLALLAFSARVVLAIAFVGWASSVAQVVAQARLHFL